MAFVVRYGRSEHFESVHSADNRVVASVGSI